ncbi:MAG: ECF transporter S component [Eubacteriales bacterium]|nr:ECF transporter S component [Eubacteriales bacterium]
MHTESDDTKRLRKRTKAAAIMILVFIPLTILFGVYFLNDRKYYIISLLIICYTMIPFIMVFERRKPQARELIIIAVLIAIAVAGRAAFFMAPQFKPVIAVVIIAAVCFGAEAGFLVGAMTGFVSNFFFGQGPWTPWQMFCFGMIGFLAGVLFQKGLLKRTRKQLCIFGGLSTFFIYGGIVDLWTIFMVSPKPEIETAILVYGTALGFNAIHAFATVVFLYILANPMIEKLERIKIKYGLLE